MWKLIIQIESAPTTISLDFKGKDNLSWAMDALQKWLNIPKNGPLNLLDDFGTEIYITNSSSILWYGTDSYEKAAEKNIEASLISARAQATFQQKIQADPKMRFLQGMPPQGLKLG